VQVGEQDDPRENGRSRADEKRTSPGREHILGDFNHELFLLT
jgi:hypothetical protein